jgi:hypothetical protein
MAEKKAAFPAVVLFVGLAGLGAMTRRPEFQMFRAVDVTQLFGSGMCFGAGLVLLITRLRARHS